MKRLNKGFTLVEILLAMLLMGIIAVSVLPGITKNAEQQLFMTQLKKVQNELQQATLILLAKNRNDLSRVFTNADYQKGLTGTVFENDDMDDRRNNFIFAHAIKSALQAHCVYYQDDERDTNNNSTSPVKQAQLFANRNPHFMNIDGINGNNAKQQLQLYSQNINNNTWAHPANFVAMNLKDGATVRPVITNVGCTNGNVCGALEVDLNGTKNPNIVGRDIHFFWIVNSDDGIVPFGENTTYDNSINNIANNNGYLNFNGINITPCTKENSGKLSNFGAALGCTAKALQDGKIKYY